MKSTTSEIAWRHPDGDPAAYWALLSDDEKIELAQAQLNMNISYLKEQVNQLNKEIDMHQMALNMIVKKRV
jgi:hypothetical protein